MVVTAGLVCLLDLNDGSLSVSGRSVKYVPTGSMDGHVTEYDIDSFPAKTLVMVKDADIGDVEIGDVVVFDNNGITTVHRCIGIGTDAQGNLYLTCRGDANSTLSTETVHAGDVEGIVVGTSHWMGVLVGFVNNSTILFVAVIIVLCVMAVTVKDMVVMMRNKE